MQDKQGEGSLPVFNPRVLVAPRSARPGVALRRLEKNDHPAPQKADRIRLTEPERRSVDASVPHYLNALRATLALSSPHELSPLRGSPAGWLIGLTAVGRLARCPIPLRALVGFAYLRFTNYDH